MSFRTSITIGDRTEAFDSSTETLGTNIYASLLICGVSLEVCNRLHEALMKLVDYRELHFQEEGVTVIADTNFIPQAVEPLAA